MCMTKGRLGGLFSTCRRDVSVRRSFVSPGIQNTTDRVVIWGATTSVTCPGQRRADPPKTGVTTNSSGSPTSVQAVPGKMVDGDPVTIPLGLVMINDIALANVSGEVFSEIGQHVKKDSLFDRTVDPEPWPHRLHPHRQSLSAARRNDGEQSPQTGLRRAGHRRRLRGPGEAVSTDLEGLTLSALDSG
jgi:hypothetical protein